METDYARLCRSIKETIPIQEYMRRQGYSFIQRGGQLYCAEIDGLWITPDSRLWYDHITGEGGSVIDLVPYLDGRVADEAEAVEQLRRLLPLYGYRPGGTRPAQPLPQQPLELPERGSGKFSRLFAYLIHKRGLDADLISELVRRNMLYEDAPYHNCVFVGMDEAGKPGYCSKRSTGYKKFVMDAVGSRKEIGWFVDNQANTLFVTESPIDAMSVMCLLRLRGKDPHRYSYLAQGGCGSLKALHYWLPRRTNISRICLCYDSDLAGRNATVQAAEQLQRMGFAGKVIAMTPQNKDFNDDLLAARMPERSREAEKEEHILEVSIV